MPGGLSPDDLLTLFRTIESPATIAEIRAKRRGQVDSLLVARYIQSGVHYGFVVETDGKFFPSEELLNYGVERMQKAVTLYQEWLDSLKRQRDTLVSTTPK